MSKAGKAAIKKWSCNLNYAAFAYVFRDLSI